MMSIITTCLVTISLILVIILVTYPIWFIIGEKMYNKHDTEIGENEWDVEKKQNKTKN